jgi:hypothetical protein
MRKGSGETAGFPGGVQGQSPCKENQGNTHPEAKDPAGAERARVPGIAETCKQR